MNTTLPATSSATLAQTVVQNDSSAVAVKASATQTAYALLEQLTVEREVWQDTVYRTSNEHLYALLQKCYQFYTDMCTDTANAKALRQALTDYSNIKSYVFTSATHSLTKIVKCVFGADRRRVSAYSIALRAALSNNVKAQDIPAFINDGGGVEQLRLAKSSTSMTPKQKAAVASDAVADRNLAVVSSKAFAENFDGGKIGMNTVLLGTWQADGSIIVRAVVQNDTVVNAALASFYSTNKSAADAKVAEIKAANDSNARLSAIKTAALTA